MIRIAQLLLIAAAVALWTASRLTWVSIRSFDELGPPKDIALSGAQWSNALVPLAVLLLAAALAGLAVRGRMLRLLAVLLGAVCLTVGYLGVSLVQVPDVGPRAAALAGVPVATLVASERHITGAVITIAAAVCVLAAAVLLLRGAVTARVDRYDAPGTAAGTDADASISERGMWDALDEGRDPTDVDSPADTEGR